MGWNIFKILKNKYLKFMNPFLQPGGNAQELKTDLPKRTILLQVGSETVSIHVSEKEEGDFRIAARRLTEQYNRYKEQSPTSSPERLMALVALAQEVMNLRKK